MHEARQPRSARPDREIGFAGVDTFDEELDDARLFGREELLSQWVESVESVADLGLADGQTDGFGCAKGPATISGLRRIPRWSMTARSISPAGTRPIGQASRPSFSTAVDT